MDAKLTKIYYSPQGYWKGTSAIKKLAEAAKVPGNIAMQWLIRQDFWQIYLPAPRHIPRPKFDVATPISVHQADLLFLPHDKPPRGRKIYKNALTVVDVARRYKEAEPLTSKESAEVAKAFQSIYRPSPLTWPQMLQVDPGLEFMRSVTKEMENHKTYIHHGRTEIHRDQATVECFNRTLTERLFGHQYAVDMLLPEGQRPTAWVKRLPPLDNVRYLYQPGELEGGTKRATGPIWSLNVHQIERNVTKPNKPVVYYLSDCPKRGFVREELLVVSSNTQLPPI